MGLTATTSTPNRLKHGWRLGGKLQPRHPAEARSGPEQPRFVEHTELHPIDPQTNGPRLFCGLR